MKFGRLSILLSLIGLVVLVWYDYQIAELFYTSNTESEWGTESYLTSQLNKRLAYRFIITGVGIIALYLGIKSIKANLFLGILGIILSIALVISTFFPIWQYFLLDSTLDINFVN